MLTRSGSRRQANAPVLTSTTAVPNRTRMTLDKVQQGIRVLKQPPEGSKPDVDIVFVPGLGTDPERSWESDNTRFNWITDQNEGLARDFPKARLMLYQYESAWSGDLKVNQYMRNIANTMLVDLQERREGHTNLPLVFIGHSMGGLVIAKAITIADASRDRFPTMSECISGCLFFGTPFYGTVAASVASMLTVIGEKLDKTTSSKLLDLMKPGDENLRDLRIDFLRLTSKLSPKTELFCFYEEHETNFAQQAGLPAVFGGAIPKKITAFVTRDSATMNGTIDEMGLASNHRNLVKFDGPKDSRYQLVRAPLKRIIRASTLLVKSRINATRNIDRDTVLDVKKALEGPDGQSLRRKLDPRRGMSSWLKDAQIYQNWLYEPSGDQRRTDLIWIKGQVGRGKTSNTISVLNDLERRTAELPENSSRDVQPLVVYFFFEGATDRFTAEDVLKSFLLQLIEQQEALASHAKHFAKKKKTKDDTKENTRSALQPTIENLWQTLQDMTYDPFVRNTIYFVINNLHLLPEESPSTQKLLAYIRSEVRNMGSSDPKRVPVRWFVSSRNADNVDAVLQGPLVRLVDLEDEKYEDQVQKELRKHAFVKVSALRKEKNYDRDVAYFAHSLIGKRAQNMQWIDITYLQLKALSADDSRLKVRQILDTIPQDVNMLLENAWQQVFRQNINVVEKIKEMLRALVLTFEDPIAPELGVLAGIPSGSEGNDELRQLVEKCKPLLTTTRGTDSKEVTIGFTNIVVKGHLLANSKKLLGLSTDETKWQHGMLAFRSFEHLIEKFAAVVVTESDSEPQTGNEADDNNELANAEIDAEVPSDDDVEDEDTETRKDVEIDNDGNNYNDWSEDNPEDSEGEDDESDSDDSEATLDPEEEAVKDAAMAYMVKYWLRHAGCATKEIAEDLTASDGTDFWTKESTIRRRWLIEFARLDGRLNNWPVRSMSSLHVAAAVGFPDLVDALIKDGHQGEIDDTDDWDDTPLHLAANFNQVDIVDVLLRAGAKIDHGKEQAFQTPLHMASYEGYVKVMKKLIAKGADINAYADDAGPVLNAAIASGNREAVELLIDNDVKLSIKHNENAKIPSPLAAAALNSDTKLFDFLISKVANRLPSEDYDQALRFAAGAGQTEVFEKLLVYDHPDETYQAAMERATEENEWGIVKTILERRTGLDCHTVFVEAAVALEDHSEVLYAVWRHTNETLPMETINEALYKATDCENENIVRILLEKFGADPNAEAPASKIVDSENKDDNADENKGENEDGNGNEEDVEEPEGNYGNTLTAAANDGTINIIKMLLDKGASIDSPAGWPLQAAAAQGHIDVVQELIKRGADINHMTANEGYQGGTALQVACRFGQTEIVRLLLEHGADTSLGAGEWTCPLIAATGNGEEEIAGMLLNSKAEVNVYGGRYNGTPLMLAASWLSVESVRRVLQAGADINAFDEDRDTALILAAKRGDSECIKLLLEHGADIMLTNNMGQNALQTALDKEDTGCMTLLVDAVSKILASIKIELEAGDETAARIVRNAGVDKPTKIAPNNDNDADSPGDEEVPDKETKPGNIARSYTSGLEVSELDPPTNTTRNEDHSWHAETDSNTTQPAPYTTTRYQQTEDMDSVLSGQKLHGPGDYTVGSSVAPSPPVTRREPAPSIPSIPPQPSSTERLEPDYRSPSPPSQPPYYDPTTYSQHNSYQSYNPSQSTIQHPAANNYPILYNSPPHQPPSPSYEIPNYQSYNPQTGYGQPPVNPAYQSYNGNQNYNGSSYGEQNQHQSRPELDERDSSSSLFGNGMKDTFGKAKQFGMSRWR